MRVGPVFQRLYCIPCLHNGHCATAIFFPRIVPVIRRIPDLDLHAFWRTGGGGGWVPNMGHHRSCDRGSSADSSNYTRCYLVASFEKSDSTVLGSQSRRSCRNRLSELTNIIIIFNVNYVYINVVVTLLPMSKRLCRDRASEKTGKSEMMHDGYEPRT
jgi:hypothetical protein